MSGVKSTMANALNIMTLGGAQMVEHAMKQGDKEEAAMRDWQQRNIRRPGYRRKTGQTTAQGAAADRRRRTLMQAAAGADVDVSGIPGEIPPIGL